MFRSGDGDAWRRSSVVDVVVVEKDVEEAIEDEEDVEDEDEESFVDRSEVKHDDDGDPADEKTGEEAMASIVMKNRKKRNQKEK